MKTALCFSGQPRCVKECYKSIVDKIIVPNSIEDIFVHTWWKPEFGITGIPVHGRRGAIVPSTVLNFIEDNYKPKKFVVKDDSDLVFHPPESIKSPKMEPDLDLRGGFSMFYCRDRCNLLRKEYAAENGIRYDAIIFTRFDNYSINKIRVNTMDLAAANVTNYLDNPADPTNVSDVIMIGNEHVINIYSDTYNNLPLISTQLYHFYGETILGKWLAMNNIPIHESIRCPDDIICYRVIPEMIQYHPNRASMQYLSLLMSSGSL